MITIHTSLGKPTALSRASEYRGEVVYTVVSHFRRFGLTIHTGSRRANEKSKTEAMRFPIAPRATEAEDIPEDIEIDEDRFMSF